MSSATAELVTGKTRPVSTAIPSPQVLQNGSDLNSEAKKTSHIVLEAFDTHGMGLDVLHQDLFDSNTEVVVSALDALGRKGHPHSLKYISRLLTQEDDSIRCAAVKAIGKIGHSGTTKVLFDLFKIAKSEPLRCAVLEALSKVSPKNPEVLRLVREYSTSKLVSSSARAQATVLLMKVDDNPDVGALLDGSKEEVIGAVYTTIAREENEELARQVIQHGLAHYPRLCAENRRLLISIASIGKIYESARVLLEGLADVDAEVRQAAYSILGQCETQLDHFEVLIKHLAENVDPVPTLEEEALEGIARMERCLTGRPLATMGLKDKIFRGIVDLFKVLSTADRRVGSDSHELGWLIARSKEYVEYYADEDFRQALLHYLKGSNYYTEQRVLLALKGSAVKVEVRHFDGYRALADVIKNPKRPGIALISRELAIAKLGKRALLYRLVRLIRLTRLLPAGAWSGETQRLVEKIFSWARQAKLFRVAEAALYALAKTDLNKTADACRECLRPPVESKVLAITAIRLLKELEWRGMEPVVLKLLGSSEESYIILNLIDALSGGDFPVSGELIKCMVQILKIGSDREILQRISDFLGAQSTLDVFESVSDGYDRAESWRQGYVMSIFERNAIEQRVSNREGLIEFLYKVLRGEANPNQWKAAVLLWRLGDDYAMKILKDFLKHQNVEVKMEILGGLKGALDLQIAPLVVPLLRVENASLHGVLQDTLLSAEEQSLRDRICELVLAIRGGASPAEESAQESDLQRMHVDFQNEKNAYRFEREYVQELAILFTDIQGYSKKAQALSTMQLSSLIQEYEGILLPTMTSHQGQLIKKMGDGHLFVFESALFSVLAAIRLQKALKRFNNYREEHQRLIVRVGIHWGKVVRKEGDVLGNHVNIASRLESSAKGGSVFISEALFERLEDFIHTREIGLISVKGISESVKVYEPYEVVIDFPSEFDPLKRAKTPDHQKVEQHQTVPGNGKAPGKAVILDQKTLSYLVNTFSSLQGLCRKAEANQIKVEEIRRELTNRWNGLKSVLKRETEI
ncbi:MAG: HEAT repeat domain-containing protein [Spirochaetaceae bacterium]|nr:MAG: HEAT repeat domain-containing protein [Spirochaetaceae bacterium]